MAKVNKEVDEVFAKAGLQERLYCWFSKHRRQVYVGYGAFFVILLLWIGCVVVKNNKVHAMQREYIALDAVDSKLAFVKKYKANPLCGLVLLDLGDESESQGDFRTASSYYSLAIKAFKTPDIRARSEISYAVSRLRMGDQSFFEKSLDTILHDEKIAMHFRADALSKLIGHFRSVGDDIKITELTHYASGLDLSDGWRKVIAAASK
ncbi:MAG: hypothetical protein K2L13_02720 [Opitutales bacterium]|nr:hypothetical protein [Opitutales bacterium]